MQSAASSVASSVPATPTLVAAPSGSTYTVAVTPPAPFLHDASLLDSGDSVSLTRSSSQAVGGRASFGMSKLKEFRARPTSPPWGGGQLRFFSAESMHFSVSRSP